MKAAASAAAALLPRASPLTFLLDPVMPATAEAAASMAVLLWDRAAALAFRASVETEQAAMEETASSSNFLQVEKASLQAFRPWAIADTSVILQSLTASLAMVISGADQQAQASVAVASLLMVIHSVARVLNKSVALTQASTKVMLGMGKSVVKGAFRGSRAGAGEGRLVAAPEVHQLEGDGSNLRLFVNPLLLFLKVGHNILPSPHGGDSTLKTHTIYGPGRFSSALVVLPVFVPVLPILPVLSFVLLTLSILPVLPLVLILPVLLTLLTLLILPCFVFPVLPLLPLPLPQSLPLLLSCFCFSKSGNSGGCELLREAAVLIVLSRGENSDGNH